MVNSATLDSSMTGHSRSRNYRNKSAAVTPYRGKNVLLNGNCGDSVQSISHWSSIAVKGTVPDRRNENSRSSSRTISVLAGPSFLYIERNHFIAVESPGNSGLESSTRSNWVM